MPSSSQLCSIADKMTSGPLHSGLIGVFAWTSTRLSYDDIAERLKESLTVDLQAQLLNVLIAADQEECLDNDESDIAMTLFDSCVLMFEKSVLESAQNS